MVHSVSSMSIPGIHFAQTGSGKMPVPVDPSSLMYSNFEHVAGIPAPEGSSGVSISALHILDVLIGRLNQAEENAVFFDGIDSIVDASRLQYLEASRAHQEMPYLPVPPPPMGLLFTLSA
ncbi:MAG: hypothetical protein FWG77_08760 [Treponema sp.]|nr:hypothetical protein [Treponema sp.]